MRPARRRVAARRRRAARPRPRCRALGGRPLWSSARGPRAAGDLAGERSGVNSACGMSAAPSPQRDGVRGLVLIEAPGSGTRIDGRPITASSATVEAPGARHTRCASAMRCGRSLKKGCASKRGRAAHRPWSRREILVARLLRDDEEAPGAPAAARSRPARFAHHRAPWLPPKTRSRNAAALRQGRIGRPAPPRARPADRIAGMDHAAPPGTPSTVGKPVAITETQRAGSGWRGPSRRSARG